MHIPSSIYCIIMPILYLVYLVESVRRFRNAILGNMYIISWKFIEADKKYNFQDCQDFKVQGKITTNFEAPYSLNPSYLKWPKFVPMY